MKLKSNNHFKALIITVMFILPGHTCDRVVMSQLEILKFLTGDLVSQLEIFYRRFHRRFYRLSFVF